jgi:7-keto-8-aminopelargonate synthetase-like enzyme
VIEPEPLHQIDRTYVLWRRRKLSYFSGCDYFRLSSHPKVHRALIDGLKRYGLSVAASRMTSGNHTLYVTLEKRLARFFKAEAALLVPSGYVANVVVAQALAGQFSHALIDEAVHPSLRDAAEALEVPILKFPHRSPAAVLAVVNRCGEGCRPILLTDGMFSHNGTVAPLKEYLAALPQDAALLVDDAHGAGVLGVKGCGTVELSEVGRRRVIQTVTLSKALGVYGGAILGSSSLRQKLAARSRLFVGSTPLPLPLVSAVAQSLAILETDQSLRSRIFRHTTYLRNVLLGAGVPVPQNPGPIIALTAKRPGAVPKIRNALLEAAIYPPFIHYPGGPPSGYFRFVLSSEHTVAQLEDLAQVFTRTAHFLLPVA